ncbi:TolC family protein, partial [Pararobbsia alpina]|uniref:Uncharacterized protein n=1 Tax=Pararobbsia alpina TaxID=621374 RepID=A0A6S7CAV2_9BURK
MTASSLFWSLGPSIVGTVFDGGQHEANLRGANAQYDIAVADYRQTVLTAFQQVEDGLSAARVLSQEAQSQQSAVDASGQALDRAMNRFKEGAISTVATSLFCTLIRSARMEARCCNWN